MTKCTFAPKNYETPGNIVNIWKHKDILMLTIKDSFYYYLTFLCAAFLSHSHPTTIKCCFHLPNLTESFLLSSSSLVHFMAVVDVCEEGVLSLIQIAVTSIGACYLLEHGELNNDYWLKWRTSHSPAAVNIFLPKDGNSWSPPQFMMKCHRLLYHRFRLDTHSWCE